MNKEWLERISNMPPKRLALLAAQLKEQLDANAARAREPIAVIGMGCRLPGGVSSPDAFWELLTEGRDAIREVPADRWDIDALYDPDPDAPGRMSTRSGGFLERIGEFDNAFFGITPREAQTMDPQQRLLLEVAWEALEHAGLSPAQLAGSATGVFVGICNSDHFQRVLGRGVDEIDAYLASGSAHSVAAGRLSYFLGLHGPSLAIDTACSSSLVALHVGCQSLRRGESRVVLAGGVNVMCSPETTIALSKAHMLAPDGRCKTFAASADGFSRGEGCGVIVLKRLSDALADGDAILGVVRGTAVNQDGRSGGLTVPNGPAQEAVIRAALADAGVEPADIGYVEAHGTGTTLGDPIEVRALAGALGPGRDTHDPLVLGSVKTNIGHLESAAGIAGVMKVILSLVHERIPRHLHFREPSPHIAWAEYPVTVASAERAWARGSRRRLAGVSSFGFSGTNAHIVIEEAPVPSAAPESIPERPVHALPLSARTPDALAQLVARAQAVLSGPSPARLADVAHTAGVGRSHFSERLAIVASHEDEAATALSAFRSGAAHPALFRGTAVPGAPPEVVFLFSGQGSQYPGMGQKLYEASPVYRDVIDRCDAILGADSAGRTLREVLAPGPTDNAPVHETVWTQPALFAVEYALTQLWRSWGIEPAAVIGHSAGEYVAACVAGVFSLEDGLRLIAERGRLLQGLPAGGAMAAVFAPVAEIAAAIAPVADRVGIAAINASDSAVISGEAEAVEALLLAFAKRNVKGHRLFVSFAAHSPLVEPTMAAMEARARAVPMSAPRIPVAWNVTGGAPLAGGAPDAAYWRRHLREPVRFSEGVASLAGYGAFLEVGPHPVLVALAQRSLPEGARGPLLLTSLRRAKDDWHEIVTSLAQLYVHGAPVDWAGVDKPYARRRVSWPTYPFQRRSFWIPAGSQGAPRVNRATGPEGNALVGARLSTAVPVFETLLTPGTVHYLGEHRIEGAVLVAGPVLLEMALGAARLAGGPKAPAVTSFVVREPLVLPADGRAVQTHLVAVDGAMDFAVHSRAADGSGEWLLHATGRLVAADRAPVLPGADTTPVEMLERTLGPATACDEFYEQLGRLGIQLGPAFRGLSHARRRDGEVLATVVLPQSCARDAVVWAHPTLLDGALQAVGLALPVSTDAGDVYLFSGVDRIALAGPLPARFTCHARVRDPSGARPAQWRADVTLRGADGAVLGVLLGVSLRRASRAALARVAGAAQTGGGLFYRVTWEPLPPPTPLATLEAPPDFVPQVRERFVVLARERGLSIYEELLPALDRLSASYIGQALRELGFDQAAGRVFEASSEASRLGILPRHGRLFARLLAILVEDGCLRARGGAFAVAAPLPASMSRLDEETLAVRYAANDGELSTLRRCGEQLARVLHGAQDPLPLLFPGGEFQEARKIYVDSPFARTYNAALAEALGAAIARLPAGARLRVLEVGAGTGGTTTYVLPFLPPDRTEYTFTDLSPLFLERAAEQFAAYPFVRRALLDIERPPRTQGFAVGGYDIVIAANVLHATADLRQTLDHVRQLLAPEGQLFLLEGMSPERWVDLTFGLTEGWWRFTDDSRRASYPLIGRQGWLELLGEVGFTWSAAIPDDAWTARGGAQQAFFVARAPGRQRRWLLVGSADGAAAAFASRLRSKGDSVELVAADAVDGEGPNLGDADEVVYLGALDLASTADDDRDAWRRAQVLAVELPLAWLARLTRDDTARRAWLVTVGAQPAAGEAAHAAMWQAPLWGVGRVFALEQPERWGGLVDLSPSAGTDADTLGQALFTALGARSETEVLEDQIAWRGDARFAARLVPAAPPAAEPVRFRGDATYLVTGGFGGLGLLVARWMAERGARHLALLGRRPDLDSAGVRAIVALGARVIPLAGDVADEGAMAALLQGLEGGGAPPLRGVVHAAADLSTAPIGAITPAQIAAMLRPKLQGTIVVHRLTRASSLDFFVLFSSTTALLGASGLAHYAAANAFLDAFAHATNRDGRRVLSVNWGTWEAMRLASEDDQRTYREGGLLPMRAAEALDALGRLLAGSDAQATVARVDWGTLKPLHEARRPRPFLTHLGAAPASSERESVASSSDLVERLAASPAGMRKDLIVEFVLGEVGTVLGIGGGEPVPLETGLFELGMDSLMSVELKKRLERGAGRPLPSTLTFNYPNVDALATFLDSELRDRDVGPAVAHGARSDAAAVLDEDEGEDGDLDALSEDAIEARLRAHLEKHR